jgi:hypothetical protein
MCDVDVTQTVETGVKARQTQQEINVTLYEVSVVRNEDP